jgi:hypothetical protein
VPVEPEPSAPSEPSEASDASESTEPSPPPSEPSDDPLAPLSSADPSAPPDGSFPLFPQATATATRRAMLKALVRFMSIFLVDAIRDARGPRIRWSCARRGSS